MVASGQSAQPPPSSRHWAPGHLSPVNSVAELTENYYDAAPRKLIGATKY